MSKDTTAAKRQSNRANWNTNSYGAAGEPGHRGSDGGDERTDEDDPAYLGPTVGSANESDQFGDDKATERPPDGQDRPQRHGWFVDEPVPGSEEREVSSDITNGEQTNSPGNRVDTETDSKVDDNVDQGVEADVGIEDLLVAREIGLLTDVDDLLGPEHDVDGDDSAGTETDVDDLADTKTIEIDVSDLLSPEYVVNFDAGTDADVDVGNEPAVVGQEVRPIVRVAPDMRAEGPSSATPDPPTAASLWSRSRRPIPRDRPSRGSFSWTGPWVLPGRELKGFAWLIRTSLLVLPVAILIGLLARGAVGAVVGRMSAESTTLTRIVLTSEVNWPFFDAVIEEVGDLARSGELATAMAASHPGDEYVLETSIPTTVDAIVDISVTAADENLAREVSEEAAVWVIDQHENRRRAELEQGLEPTRAERDRVTDLLAAEIANADELLNRQASTVDALTSAQIDRDLRVANDAISFYSEALRDLESDIREQEGVLSALSPEVAVGSVQTTASSGEDSPLPTQAGVVAFLLSGLGLGIASREYGRNASDDQLEAVIELPVVPIAGNGSQVPLARLLRDTASRSSRQVVGVDSQLPGIEARTLVDDLSSLGMSVGYLDEAASPNGDGPDIYLQPVFGHARAERMSRSLFTCDAVLIVTSARHESIRSIKRRLRRYDDVGAPVIGVAVSRTG